MFGNPDDASILAINLRLEIRDLAFLLDERHELRAAVRVDVELVGNVVMLAMSTSGDS